MNITRENRKALCDLSQQLWGSLYKWQRVIEEGEWIGGLDDEGKEINYLVQPDLATIEEYMRNRIKQVDKQLNSMKEFLKEKETTDGQGQD